MIRACSTLVLLYLAVAFPAQSAVVFSTGATWKYLKGTAEASTPVTAWRLPTFNDAAWLSGPAPFGYGEPTVTFGTTLADMSGGYTSLFLRRVFVVANPADIGSLRLDTLVDDGYIAYINGVEVGRFNMPAGSVAFNGAASTALEPTANSHTISGAAAMLVPGDNVVAIHAFNASLSGSSDFVIEASLTSSVPDVTPPTVAQVSPPPATRNILDAVTVVFSEPVTGINAGDLLINGLPATSMTGGNDTFNFGFPQPAPGLIHITWVGGHGITDLATPANAFNGTGPGATWDYTLVDDIAPAVEALVPPAGATVRNLSQIDVQFTEPVSGVQAGDLRVNTTPASGVSLLGPGHYLFSFTQPAIGTVAVDWDPGHGITDLAVPPNAFAGGAWTYTLDPDAVIPSVRINEFVAANLNGLLDEDNEAQDWVELYNTGASPVNLAGWSLTDDVDQPDQWVFPAITLGGGQYLVVFCSGKDRRPVTPGSKLHTNFKLDADGEDLVLFNNEFPRQVASGFQPYPGQRIDYSYGYNTSDLLRYFRPATPGAANGNSTITGLVADTKFSHDRGFYDSPISLVLTTATVGATIRYTLDGSTPTAISGTIYTSPIPINKTTVVRTAAYRTGLLETDVDCQTYLFLEDVIRQASNGLAPAGWPATWGQNVVDYGMDPDVVNNPLYSGTIKDDLRAIPTFSIVMKLDDLFNASTGIYANPREDSIVWERGCSMELIYPDGASGYQINGGIRVRGGFSRDPSNPKHAFRLFFRQEYGASKLNYRMFGPTGATSFDKFDMRTFQNYSWSYQGDSRQICLRDVFSRDAQLAMGRPSARGEFYHLYINGMYWGLYNSEERPEASWGESYFGGREEDYDVIKVEAGPYTINATDGNMDAWTRLWQAANAGFANDVDYFKVQGLNLDGTPNPSYENLLDVPNLIDYMLVILYGGNLDAPISNFLSNNSPNNWYGIRNRTGLFGGFRFVAHDSEHTLLNVNEDRTGPYVSGDPAQGSNLTKSNPQYVWQKLQANAEFRMLVADHVQRHCFNGGVFSTEGARANFLDRSNQIDRAIVAESARWGDAKVATPFTRATWVNAMNTVYTSFLGNRTGVLLGQMRADGLFPNISAPVLNTGGGFVRPGFQLIMTNPNASGTIFYTLDGTDPRQRGGNVAPNAVAYAGPITLNSQVDVKARVRSGTTWSALNHVVIFTEQDFGSLLVTEIMYEPPGNGAVSGDEFEFVELKNTSTVELDLQGLTFTDGITYTFPNGSRLPPGQFWVLGRNTTQLAARYPGLTVNGLYTGRLNNDGEKLTLTHPLGGNLFSFTYQEGGKWPITPGGFGYSLVPRNPNANPDPELAIHWRASRDSGGSPGADDPDLGLPAVVINEALTHTDLPQFDFIELYNPTGAPADVGGWYLTDDAAVPKKFRIPNGTVIPPQDYAVFDETQFNPTPGVDPSFTLSSIGEEVYLLSGDAAGNLTGYSHGFTFGAAFNGVSFGRHVLSTGEEQFSPQISVTKNGPNSGPRIGPIVVDKIMYHPPDLPSGVDNDQDEFIELRNMTGLSIPLYDPNPAFSTNTWKLRDAVDYTFPRNVTLDSGKSLLVVSFDPANTGRLNAFHDQYPLMAALPIYGPYDGQLDNSTDSIELVRPDAPNLTEVPYVLADKVHYRDAAPWPAGADGAGPVLERVSLAQFGSEPQNWIAAAPLSIIEHPQAQAVLPGASVLLSVHAIGTGQLRYQWRRDGVPIAGATNEDLAFPNVQEADQGTYLVEVSDHSGTATSQPAFLGVLVVPYVIQPPLSQAVVQGGTLILSVSAGGHWPISYRWRRGTLTLNNQILYAGTSFLVLENVQPSQAGNYTVVLTNQVFSTPGILSPVAAITVLPDIDGDGIPDQWETDNGLNPANFADGTADADSDGFNNKEEYLAGTDPQNPQSYLRVEGVALGGSVDVTFMVMPNKTYTVQYTDDLESGVWKKLADVVAVPTARSVVVHDPGSSAQRTYRLRTPRQADAP